MRGKSFTIALSAVACALATVFMSLGINIPVLMLTGYVFGSIALMLPLAKDFRLGGFLAYIATSLLCLAFGGVAYFYRLFPFVAFFGLHPLVNALQKRFKIKKWVAWPIKAVWFDGMLCCTLLLLFTFNVEITLPFEWMNVWLYPIVIILGTLVFLLYDWVMFRFQKFADYYVSKIERGKGGKSTLTDITSSSGKRDDLDDVFGSGGVDAAAAGGQSGGGEEISPENQEQACRGENGASTETQERTGDECAENEKEDHIGR